MLKKIFLKYPNKTRRFLEILPGFFSWSLILFPIWGSFVVPDIVAYYVIAFSVYWLYKSSVMALLSILAHFRIKAASHFDWMKDLKKNFPDKYDKIYHLIIIPTYKEPISTLDKTLKSLTKQSFPLKNIFIVLSFEKREGEPAKQKAKILIEKYKHKFGGLWATFHPDIKGEVKGKSSNTSWGAKFGKKKLVDELKLPIENITITSEDADARFHKHYFAYLTYEFLTIEKPYNTVWQGNIVFYNNIWEVPAPIRVLASIFSVSQMYILYKEDRLINFSTYSTSLKHVVSIEYWDTDVIPEDYRFFFKSYFMKKGDFDVKPIFLPIYADAAQSKSLIDNFINQYEQIKRWAWGVSDDAYIIRQYIITDGIPFWDKTIRILKVIEDHFLWPVNWFALTTAAMFPPLLNKKIGERKIIIKTLPQIVQKILTLTLVSMIIIIIIDALNRPKRPKNKKNIISYITQPLEFLLLPIISFLFSALPGLDAHTRLMLGKYIEYRVTEKV